MKRTPSPPNRHLGGRVGAALLAVSLLAGPGLATPATAVEPSPTATPAAAVAPTPTASPAVATSAPVQTSAAPTAAPPQVLTTATPTASMSPSARSPETTDRSSAAYRTAMAEATKAGGAEMGQGSRAAGAAATGDNRATTEALATEGTWMPGFGVQGLDVSKYQAGINWQAQWNMGARFAYIKATEGNYYTSTTFSDQYLGSRAVGMIRGAYHFANPAASSGADQARIFVQSGGGWSGDGYTLPPVLDFEGNPYAGQTIGGYYQGNTCYDMTPSELTSWAREFGDTMRALTGRLPVMYTTTSWWNYCTGGPAGFGDWPLWIARWPSSPSDSPGALPSSWTSFSFWQYSESGPFAGGGDSNVWNGDYTSLQRFATGTPPPAPTDQTRKLVSPGDFDGDGRPDLIQRAANGTLWFYPGDGTGKFGVGRKIGDFGWDAFDQVVGVGDFNGDGKNDLLARRIEGSLWFYAGSGTVSASATGYRGGVKVIDFGWHIFDQLIPVKDFDGDGTNDLAARRPDGTLWLYSNTGSAVLVGGRQIGTGWGIYDYISGTGDANGDNMADFVASDAGGTVFFYAGTAMKDLGLEPERKIGDFGWEAFDTLVGTKDFNGDGKPDLLARKPEGTLWFYPGNGTGAYSSGQRIGDFGWDTFNALVGVGDFNGDGKADLAARAKDGTLWLYPGTGRVDSTSKGYAAAVKIGNFGWNVFTALAGVGDFNGDGKNDILARQGDGSLWLYAGTGRVDANNSGYQGAVRVGEFGWEIFDRLLGPGDMNSDGKSDLLAQKPDGTLWLYAGEGTGKPSAPRRIGTGWTIFNVTLGAWNLNADAFPDLVSRRPDGSLWSHAGTGMKPTEGYLGRVFAVNF